jgi:hypothetical protein
MRHRAFVIVNVVFAAVFLISAAIQLNDPDPLRWIVLYVAAAIACFASGRVRHGWVLAAAVAGVSLVWAATLSPILPEIRVDDLARTMKAENPRIELSREILGLFIVFAWMTTVVVVTRRASPPSPN